MIPPFNGRHLIRQSLRSVFGTRGSHRRLTGHRITVLAVFWAIFVPHQIVTRVCFLLDDVFFPGWRKASPVRPVFITGLFRSGTTFLHRLMAGDRTNFSAMKTWEIYLAPSILQRKLLKAWKSVDRAMGAPAMKWLRGYNNRNLADIQFHQVGLWKEEEDEGLLLFLWDSLFTWFFFPDNEGIRDYIFADREMRPRRQRRKLAYYRNCIRRHMYCHPESAVYLSKNPAFTPKLNSLREAFPDARVIYLVRDPRQVLVSQAAWFAFCWRYFASPTEPYPFREELLEMTRHWYEYPLKVLDEWEEGTYRIVEYHKLISSPETVIAEVYGHFGLSMTEDYREWILKESRRTDEYASGTQLTLADTGYDEKTILSLFDDIYTRFNLAAGE